jgi:hypothetical protein
MRDAPMQHGAGLNRDDAPARFIARPGVLARLSYLGWVRACQRPFLFTGPAFPPMDSAHGRVGV